MNCEQINAQLDDFLDQQISEEDSNAIKQHLAECPHCNTQFQEMQTLLQQLKIIPIPQMKPGFQSRVLRQARPTNHHRTFWAGFGSAIAATLVLWFGVIASDTPQNGVTDIKTVVLQLEEAKTIQLAFNAPGQVQNVNFSLVLPEGINLQNKPGKRAFTWSGQLNKGRNVLNLPLLGTKSTKGELVARIEQNGTHREFRVPLQVDSQTINNIPFRSENSTTL